MPNPTRTSTIVINGAYAGAATETARLQENCIRLYSLFIAAGWTAVRSSEGTAGGDFATDRWAALVAAYGVGLEVNTAPNGAWCVFRSPSGWLNTGNAEVLVSINTAGTPFQAVNITMSFGTYAGGSDTALPTVAVQTTVGSATIFSTTGTMYWMTYFTSRGDLRFAVKVAGAAAFRTCVELWSNVDGNGGGRGSRRAWIRHETSAGCNNSDSFGTLRSLNSGGGAAHTGAASCALAWTNLTNLTGGADEFNETYDIAIDVSTNVAAGRWLGAWIDTYGCPTGFTFGELDDTESAQTNRKVCVGDIWWYMPTASLPLL